MELDLSPNFSLLALFWSSPIGHPLLLEIRMMRIMRLWQIKTFKLAGYKTNGNELIDATILCGAEGICKLDDTFLWELNMTHC